MVNTIVRGIIKEPINIDTSELIYNPIDRKVSENIPTKLLNDKEINEISEFLYNPTNKGIWKLKAQWNLESKIIIEINNQLDEFFTNNNGKAIKIDSSKMVISKDVIDRLKDRKFYSTFSFYFSLYYFIYINDKYNGDEKTIQKALASINQDDDYRLLFQILDIKKLKSGLTDSYNIFTKYVLYENMTTIVGEYFLFENGCLHIENFYTKDDEENLVYVFSVNKESLEIIKNLFMSVELFKKIIIERVFSPEKSLLQYYVPLLQNTGYKPIESRDYRELIEKAIFELDNKRCPQCVMQMGILGEHILTQIYESLFREKLDDDLALGDIYNKINENTRKILIPHWQRTKIDAESIFQELTIFNSKSHSSSEEMKADITRIFQKSLQYVREQDEDINKKVNKQLAQNLETSIFPANIRSNFKYLLRYRNGVSHKSSIHVEDYEAIKTIFCGYNMLIWWEKEKLTINWDNSIDEIIKALKEKNNPSLT